VRWLKRHGVTAPLLSEIFSIKVGETQTGRLTIRVD